MTLIKNREYFLDLDLGQKQYKFIILCLLHVFLGKETEMIEGPNEGLEDADSDFDDNMSVVSRAEVADFLMVMGGGDGNQSVLNESFRAISTYSDW
jgi:hypothetical protein